MRLCDIPLQTSRKPMIWLGEKSCCQLLSKSKLSSTLQDLAVYCCVYRGPSAVHNLNELNAVHSFTSLSLTSKIHLFQYNPLVFQVASPLLAYPSVFRMQFSSLPSSCTEHNDNYPVSKDINWARNEYSNKTHSKSITIRNLITRIISHIGVIIFYTRHIFPLSTQQYMHVRFVAP